MGNTSKNNLLITFQLLTFEGNFSLLIRPELEIARLLATARLM